MIGIQGIKVRMRRIRVENTGNQGGRGGLWEIALGMRVIGVGILGIGGRNEENQVENLGIGLEMMNKSCGAG